VASCEVPDPELRSRGTLVQTAFFALSAETERAYREQVEKSIIGKAMARPDIVRQVIFILLSCHATPKLRREPSATKVTRMKSRLRWVQTVMARRHQSLFRSW